MIPAERGSPLINRALSLFDNNDTFAEKADVLASPWLGLAAPPDGLARVRTKGVPRACYPQEQPIISGWRGNMLQTMSFRKKGCTDADCSLLLALLYGEYGVRGRGSGPCLGAARGGRAIGWACVPHIDF